MKIKKILSCLTTLSLLNVTVLPISNCSTNTGHSCTITKDDNIEEAKYEYIKDGVHTPHIDINCKLTSNYQIHNVTMFCNNGMKIHEKYIDWAILPNNIVRIYTEPIEKYGSTNFEVSLTSCPVREVKVVFNSNKFVVPEITTIRTDEEFILTPKSNQYNGVDVHDVTTIETRYSINSTYELAYDRMQYYDGEYWIPWETIRSLLEYTEDITLQIDLNSSKLTDDFTFSKLGEISALPNSIEVAQSIFNYGDYILSYDTYGNEYKIRIVDMGADTTTSGSKATFTFEFFTPILEKDGDVDVTAWNASVKKNYDYTNSTVFNFVKSGYPRTVLNQVLGDSTSYLKTIKKDYLYAGLTTDWTHSTFESDFFLPNLTNMVSHTCIDNWSYLGAEEYKNIYKTESNLQYKFYQIHLGDNNFVYGVKRKTILEKRKPNDSDIYSTWIGTPWVKGTTDAMCYHDKYIEWFTTWNMVGVAPEFCF